ncbi:MAG: GntR family transcriptional regulator, partial [Pseudomonadota bacterium]
MNPDAPRALTKTIQLSEMLTREIAAGRYPDGTRLPTERQMAENLGVAVGTLRRSLSILEDRGLLRRVQGSGNYIRVRPEIEGLYEFFRLELLGGGGSPTADVLSVRRMAKSKRVANIGPGLTAHRIRRIRYLDAIPVEVEEIWLDGRFIEQISHEDLQDSLYNYYKEVLNVVIGSVTDKVGNYYNS